MKDMDYGLAHGREANHSNRLLWFFRRIEDLYKRYTGKRLYDLCQVESIQRTGNILAAAVLDICETSQLQHDAMDIDLSRSWQEMTLADIKLFSECLKYSLKDEFLLVHYDERAMWGNTALGKVEDVWKIYQGLLMECRSTVVNLKSMEYALLPFAKFRNLGEAEEYSLEVVREKIENAATVEFSEKLDGSFIQMRYIGDDRFLYGILMSSSGLLDPERSYQLADTLAFMKEKGENIRHMVTGMPEVTFMFEWIDEGDPHVVGYPIEMQGLHLVGMRHVGCGRQYAYTNVAQTAAAYNVPATKLYAMTLEEVLATLGELHGSEREGYVLYVDGFLVKIKCPDFLGLFHDFAIKRGFDAIAKVAAEGNADDYISMLPKGYRLDARRKLRKILTYEQDIIKRVEEECAKIPEGVDRKTAMIMFDKIEDKFIRSLARQKYLGRPINPIARKKGANIQYVKEGEIDEYYSRQTNVSAKDCAMDVDA